MTERNAAQIKVAQIKIRLINAIDEALISRELLSPKSLRSCEVEAVLDPSLVYLVLPEQVVRQLGLRRVSPQPLSLPVTEALRLEWDGQIITEDALIAGDHVRLGRVVLEKLNLLSSSRGLANQSADEAAIPIFRPVGQSERQSERQSG